MYSHDHGTETHQAQQAMRTLSFAVIYAADPRPTLAIDLSVVIPGRKPVIAYTNPALDAADDLLGCFEDALQVDNQFRSWAFLTLGQGHYYRYGGSLWFGFVLQDRWKVISTVYSFSGTEPEPQSPSTTIGVASSSNYFENSNGSLEANIGRINGEIRSGEFGRKQAARQARLCSDTVSRLKQELGVLKSDMSHVRSPSPVSNTGRPASQPPMQSPDQNLEGSPPSERRRQPPQVTENASVPYQNPLLKQSSSSIDSSNLVHPINLRESSDKSTALERFQRLAEAVDVGFFEFDTSGHLLYANESWYALSGHPRDPEQHTELSFQKCIYPDDFEYAMGQWAKIVQGQALTFEMRWRKLPPRSAGPDAPVGAQWVLSACVPVIGENGQVTSVSGCTTDISAQKQTAQAAMQRAEALERARASEERFSRFAEVAPIAIFRFDKSKNIEYCNDRWFEMTGVPRTRFEDVVWPYGVYEDDIEMCSRVWDKSIEHRSVGQIEFRLRKEWQDGHGRRGQRWVFCTFFAEVGEDGKFNGLMGSLLDISHLKWAENTQKLRAEEALEAKRLQENFIDITSHEMRNPLSAMVQCADSIMASLTDTSTIVARRAHLRSAEENKLLKDHIDNGIDAAQTILSCAAHQRRIVDDVLTLSKLDSNLLLVTPVNTDPIQMVQNIIRMFALDSEKEGVILTHETDQSFEQLDVQWLLMDPSRVSQILINLLGNAIKFTRTENTREVTVRMSVSLEPPSRNTGEISYVPAESTIDSLGDAMDTDMAEPIYLNIEVQDTGRGLSPEEKEKLFIRFSQASPKTHVQYGGSGLGLFISRRLTEMQGGEIGFSSTANIGSIFAFYIKSRKLRPPEPEVDFMTPQPANRRSSTAISAVGNRPLNLLLVEDNLVNQKVLGKQLQKQGCTVFVAGNGQEALDFLRSTEMWTDKSVVSSADTASELVGIDIVLMDIEMPVMGGLECTRRIRKFEEESSNMAHLPIISISANARQEQVDEAKLAGVDDTITKPFRINELMPKLRRLTDPQP